MHAMAGSQAWPSRRPANHPTRATMATERIRWGSRAENSLTPNILKLSAVTQNASGGFPQYGTPYSNQGVTQSFSSTILRPISPYRASVESISGAIAVAANRIAHSDATRIGTVRRNN